MIAKLGNIIFRYRNGLFPIFFIVLIVVTRPMPASKEMVILRYVIGGAVAFSGQVIRAMTIGLAYIIRGGRNRRVYAEDLVTSGIFSHCRNPLYTGNILVVIGLAIVANSFAFYIIGIPAFIFMYYAIIRAEETFLEEKFGPQYVEYCRTANRFIPRLKGLRETLSSMRFNWARLVLKEYGTTYVWIACIIGLIARNHYLKYGPNEDVIVYKISGISFLVLSILYGIARYLKKSGRLVDH